MEYVPESWRNKFAPKKWAMKVIDDLDAYYQLAIYLNFYGFCRFLQIRT